MTGTTAQTAAAEPFDPQNSPLITSAAEYEKLRRTVTTIEIPEGFDRWHPNEITEWLSQIEDDETVSEPDFYRARQAVYYALGIDPFPSEGKH
ncbi:hypothetical protein [Streptomyces sp. MBT53]|uniref:hypothetical protein n=1 Tax=Streptomyces sp. MBT53 TaxID=1488384 RepID=UPI001911B4F1|nr:hypothetical protein [Streptomyces sp. MBT53]MBK6017596.1 hypothetical protein [Streptomyces sp. MBT53]